MCNEHKWYQLASGQFFHLFHIFFWEMSHVLSNCTRSKTIFRMTIPIYCDSIPDNFSDIAVDDFIAVDEGQSEKSDIESNQNSGLFPISSNDTDTNLIDYYLPDGVENDLDDMDSSNELDQNDLIAEKEEHLSMIDSYNQKIFEKAFIKKAKEEYKKSNKSIELNSQSDEHSFFDMQTNSTHFQYYLSKADDIRMLLDEEQRQFEEDETN